MGDEIKSGEKAAAAGKNTEPTSLDKGRRKGTSAPEVPDLMKMVMGGLESDDSGKPEKKDKADKASKAAKAKADAGDDDDNGGDDEESKKAKAAKARAEKDDEDADEHHDDDDRGGEDDDDDNARGGSDDDSDDDDKSESGKGGKDDDDDQPHAEDLQKLAAETKKFVAGRLKDLPDAQRLLVEQVIGQRVAKVVATERGERERLEAQVADMTGELEKAERAKGPPVIAGIHPALLAESDDELNDIEDKLLEAIDWADDHADGYNLEDSEDYNPKEPSMTAEQIRQRARALRREKDRILPQARENLKKRAEHEAPLKKALPALFDPKTAEYRQAHLILKEQPWLRQFPDFRVRVARQILGERALAGLLKANAKSADKADGKKPTHEADDTRRATRLPGAGGPAKGGGDGRKPAGSGASQAYKHFGREGAFSAEALARDVESMLPAR